MMLHRRSPAVLAVCLLNITLPARAADFKKYLLDDTDGVLTVNVKQLVSAPAYTRHLQKQIERILDTGAVKEALKGSGLDPVKDIERVIVVTGHSLSPVQGDVKEGTPMMSGTIYLIIQGNLDAALLKHLAERAAKDSTFKVSEQKVSNASLWQVTGGPHPLYFAVPEKGTVIISGIKGHVADALAKGIGKTKTRLKSKAMEDLLAKLDPKASASWAATNDMIYAWSAGGTGGTVKVMHHTLGDDGITAATASLTVVDDLQGTITLTCNDADRASSLQNFWKEGLKFALKEITDDEKRRQELAPLAAFLKDIKITSKDQTVIFKAQGSAQVIEALLKLR